MRMFDQNSKTYKTPANAEKALVRVLANNDRDLEDFHWMISVNSEGRYFPVVTGCKNGKLMAAFFAYRGICALAH